MYLHPTVVIGLGSTGKFVVANAQKYLYEVLNGAELKLFRFIVLETDVNTQDQHWTSVGVNTKPVDIKVQNIGQAYVTMKGKLGNEFTDWCPDPKAMLIEGPGAGNKRAGGRLMLFHNMHKVQEIIQNASRDVRNAAMDDRTIKDIEKLLTDRGAETQAKDKLLPNQPDPVFLIVGTLTGGTCSGACIDLAYLLNKISPRSPREAIFFIPDGGAIDAYKANTWAALSDLAYFTRHAKDYHAAWLNMGGRESYDAAKESIEKPYRYIYLVSQRDSAGSEHLPYRNDPGSPLLMMSGLYVAANLLGLYHLRDSRLSDLNQRILKNDPVYKTFLTHSIRGVSYPKYDISEAAACKIIADRICHYWLSQDEYLDQGHSRALQKEDISRLGRELWNEKCAQVWAGLRGQGVDLAKMAVDIKSGHIPDVAKRLSTEIGEPREGTIFSQIDQNVEHRRRGLQDAIRDALVKHLQRTQNLQYGDCFLNGVREEIERTLNYWQALDISPGKKDLPGWQGKVRDRVERLMTGYSGLSVNMLSHRLNAIEDDLEQIVRRLEMFLMHRILSAIAEWIKTDLQAELRSIRELLTDVQTYVRSREKAIEDSLADTTGPLLKVSRSNSGGFAEEITTLASKLPSPISGEEYIVYKDGVFHGILFPERIGTSPRDRVFQHLIEKIQNPLIKKMQENGSIDIDGEIKRQNVYHQTIQRAQATQLLSLSTDHELMMGKDFVPSLLLAKNYDGLEKSLKSFDRSFPNLQGAALPLFDHMALFYQEGGEFNLDSLKDSDAMKRSYDLVRQTGEWILDPLGHLKKAEPIPSEPEARSES